MPRPLLCGERLAVDVIEPPGWACGPGLLHLLVLRGVLQKSMSAEASSTSSAPASV
jgi:hypothetical protein